MRNLRLPAKLALIGALALLPLFWLTTMWVLQQSDQLAFARNELAGARTVSALLDVAVWTQTHRGQTNMALSGNETARGQLPDTRRQWQAALQKADEQIQGQPDWPLTADWARQRDAQKALAQGQHAEARAAAFAAHTTQVTALTNLMQLLGEQSQLLFDPEADSYFMAEMNIVRLLPWSETLGLLRGQGAGLLAKGEATPEERLALLARLGVLQDQMDGLQRQVQALSRHGKPSAAAAYEAAARPSQTFIDQVKTAFAQETPTGEASAYFQAGTQAIKAVVGFQRQMNDDLVHVLEARTQRLQRTRQFSLLGAGLCVLLLSYAGWSYYRSTVHVVRRVERAARAVAGGDLTVTLDVEGRDELAEMAGEINTMRLRLADLVQRIRVHAQTVAQTGDHLSNDSHDLAVRTTQQASSVEESAATLAQVAQTVRQNGEQVRQVGQLFIDVKRTVDSGTHRMQSAVQTVEGIEATSRRVAEIISVIDNIAFQTNILALNAAVEAARAGEQGRGFAVVASEVRSLAQRCIGAAGEIRTLIAASVEQVEAGAGQIREVSSSLAELMGQVQQVDTAMKVLAHATVEQTAAVDQVAEAVRLIGETTEGNAHSVQNAAIVASQLEDQARALIGMVAELKTDRREAALA